MILVDTSAWSHLLRRKNQANHPIAKILTELIKSDESLFLCGIVYQEILQGIRDKKQYAAVKHYLDNFDFLQTDARVHELAAQVFTQCQKRGVSASTVDSLITALALFHDCFLLAADGDFKHMQRCTDLKLYPV